MSNNIKNKISEKIISHSNGDARLGELLSYCVGRLCLSFDKAGKDWEEALSSIDVPHITDWLKAAIINEADWLKKVDDQNRPKKLMKFGSFEDIQKEADKAMLKANQQNNNTKLVEGDEELYMQLDEGYHLVKLLTPAALDRESNLMQHCIGNGAYDKRLLIDGFKFLSLRDAAGKPHATLEIEGGKLNQLQGKQNEAPKLRYANKLKTFFVHEKLQLNVPIRNTGYVICSEGNIHNIENLPDGLMINGNLNLNETSIQTLPGNLEVSGNLHLCGTSITALPDDIKIGGSLQLEKTQIQKLPDGFAINGNLSLYKSSIRNLPCGLKVGGDLLLGGTIIKTLPKDVKVGGNLQLCDAHIQSLPSDIEIGGGLDLTNAKIKALPDGLEIGGTLSLFGTSIKSLPNALKVGGNLDLEGLCIQYFPDDIKIGGNLHLERAQIQKLPNWLAINGNLDLYKASIGELPNGLKVGGNLDLSETEVKTLPEDLEVGGRILGFIPEPGQQFKAVSI